MKRKILTLLIAIALVFALSFVVSAACYEDYEMARIAMMSEKVSNYNPGGDDVENGEIDGKLGTGIAGNWKDGAGTGVVYKYSKQHLVREINITFGAPIDEGTGLTKEGYGYKIYLSSDSGSTWQEVGSYISVVDDTKETRTYKINGGNGMQANAFKFEYTGNVLQYSVSLFEVSITGSNVLGCQWDAGSVQENADCGNDGKTLYTCSVCGGTKEEPIPATGNHSWDEGQITEEPSAEKTGIKTYTCTVCDYTKEEVLPMTGHNWDNGTIVPPTCTEDGYTVYACTDDGCDETYNGNIVEKLGHDMDNGVITTPSSINTQGTKTYSCTRDDCDYTEEEKLPLASYDDNKIKINQDYILSVEEVLANADKASSLRSALGMFDGKTSGGGQSATAAAGGWFAPSGSYVLITFREEIHVLSIDIYGWSNWNNLKVEFLDSTGAVVASYINSGFQMMDGSATPVSNVAGKLVKAVKVTSVGAKGDDGNCLVIHEIEINAHEHQCLEGEDNYNQTQATCTKYATYTKKCYVCEKEVIVETGAKEEHQFTEFVEQTLAPTCVNIGKDKYKCATCEATTEKDVDATGIHVWSGECDTVCNTCPETRESSVAHTSDYVCYDADNKCNVCEAELTLVAHTLDFACKDADGKCSVCTQDVTLADHTWEAGCDTECGVCGETRVATGDHAPDYACYDADGKCNFCQVDITISVAHTTDYACKDADGKCNVCNQDVTLADHTWASNCDTTCDVCSDTRTGTDAHTTDFACYDADGKCNACDETVTIDVAHTSDFACHDADSKCNVCDQDITIDAPHTTDKACKDADGKCNACDQAVTLADHTWAGACDSACDVCDEARTVTASHTTDKACKDADGKCNTCGASVTLADHTYAGDCDTECNVCADTRTVTASHTTDKTCNDADSKCNVCGVEVTLADHTYAGDCDLACDVCNATRKSDKAHKTDFDCYDADGKCNICGAKVTVNGAHTTDYACNDADMKCNVCAQAVTTGAHTWADCDTECDVCKVTREVTASHTYGDWTVTKEATKDADGEKTRTCSACGYVDIATVVYEGGLGAGAVVGIVAGSVVVAGVGGFSLFWFVIKKKSWADLIAVFKK